MRVTPRVALPLLALLAFGGAWGRAAPETSAGTYQRVVALGDSVPSGEACSCRAYPDQLADALAAQSHHAVEVRNLAVAGATSGSLLQDFDPFALGSAAGRVTIVNVGANDFDPGLATLPSCEDAACWREPLATLRTNLGLLLDKIRATQPDEPSDRAPVMVVGYWNVFLDGAVGGTRGAAYVQSSDRLTKLVDAVLADVGAQHGASYVDVYRAFKGDGDRDDTDLLASDGDHPDDAGHHVLAQTLVAFLHSRRNG